MRISPETTTIVFPDEGAAKRFKIYFEDEYKIIVCSKVRNGNKRTIQIIDRINWPEDDSKCLENVLIIDDLVQSGGETLEECRKRLDELGCKKISAYVTHAVFPNRGYKKFFNGKFEKFYITNSIPEVAVAVKDRKPFEIINLEEDIAQGLLKSCEISNIELTKPQEFNVYVSSTNDTKMSAVYTAVSKLLEEKFSGNYKLNVYGVGVPSGVPEQPLHLETNAGCSNRLTNLKKWVQYYSFKYDFLVSIENGISWNKKNGLRIQ